MLGLFIISEAVLAVWAHPFLFGVLWVTTLVVVALILACTWKTEYSLPPGERKHVIVIGGGFAGLAVVRRLRKHFNVTLIDSKEYFEYAPGMLRPYASPSEHLKLTLSYEQLCRDMSVEWIWGHAVMLGGDGKLRVSMKRDLTNSSLADPKELAYDFCVVTSGCTYGLELDIPKRATATAECLWYPTLTKSVAGFDECQLVDRHTHIERESQTIVELHEKKATVAIIGAGPVGVEYATELRHYFPGLDIIMIESRSSCCAVLCKSARDYIQRYLDQNRIKCFYGIKYADMMQPNQEHSFWKQLGVEKPDRCFMSVGVRPQNQFVPKEYLSTGRHGGFVRTNAFLQVVDETQVPAFGGRVFAAGNCVDAIPGLDPLPKNVAPAEEMSVHVVKNIYRFQRREELLRFSWPWLAGISATSLGPHDGVCVLNNRLPGSGFVCLWGQLVAWQKELIRWSKVDECRLGWMGTIIWSLAH